QSLLHVVDPLLDLRLARCGGILRCEHRDKRGEQKGEGHRCDCHESISLSSAGACEHWIDSSGGVGRVRSRLVGNCRRRLLHVPTVQDARGTRVVRQCFRARPHTCLLLPTETARRCRAYSSSTTTGNWPECWWTTSRRRVSRSTRRRPASRGSRGR